MCFPSLPPLSPVLDARSMWMLSLYLRILTVTCVYGYEYKDHYPGREAAKVPAIQSEILQVSNWDELLGLLYPAYGLMQRCLRRRLERTTSPLSEDGHSWKSRRQLPFFKDDDTFQIILEEIQRTVCSPREVCLEVSKEFPDSTNRFYLPRCIAVHRCGGCCPNEAFQCTNTSYSLVNKTLIELSPPLMERTVVMVTVVNHTSCECQSKRPRHSIIRRSLNEQPTLCPVLEEACGEGFVLDELTCDCVPLPLLSLDEEELEPGDPTLLEVELELCGPHQLLDEESCECLCQNGLTTESCDPGWQFDEETCQCVCEAAVTGVPQPSGEVVPSCPPYKRWDPMRCGCVCHNQCPPSQPMDPDTCDCQCRESEQSCFLQGKRFKADNCSCYRLPCKDPNKKCQQGSYYSHLVCQCIPNYYRSRERDLT